jgi:hypothetical protein
VLRELQALQVFKLYHHPSVTDAGIAHLESCHEIEQVELLGSPVGDGAVKALMGKRHLRHFQAGSGITDAGLALLHHVPRFKVWHGGEVRLSLMDFAAEPTFLFLNLAAPFTNAGLAGLAGLDGLFALSLFGGSGPGPFNFLGSRVTASGLAPLAGLASLGWFGCASRLGTDEALRHVASMPRLRMLSCQDAVAGDEGFTAVSRSPTIEYIWGRRCENLTGRGFRALATMPALAGLGVTCRNVDDSALAELPRFPALRELMPMEVRDEGFRHVGRCHQLEALWCMYCRDTGDAATARISGLSRLRSYYAGYTRITDRSLEILGGMPSLERLTFEGCAAVTDAGLPALAQLPRLREVSLGGMRQVTRQGTEVFAPGVRVTYWA